MTVERGIDPRGFALMPFGGAGPLHAAALAQELGIARVLCPRASGVLCALGLAAARAAARCLAHGHACAATRSPRSAIARRARGAARASRARRSAQIPRACACAYELRYAASPSSCPSSSRLRPIRTLCARRSRAAHEQRYGYRDDDAPRSSW